MSAELETLDCGMKAIFVQPKTNSEMTAVSLVFNTGALHEQAPVVPGTSHFLEHVAILGGTASYPTIKQLLTASDKHDFSFGGFTNWTSTWIDVDGRKPDYALAICLEMGFMPNLTPKGVEQDRTAISEEARGYLHDVWSSTNDSLYQLFVGDHPSRVPSGTLDDIARIGHGDIVRFHKNHWIPSNATLYVASKKSPEILRRYVNNFMGQILDVPQIGPKKPIRLDLPWLQAVGETVNTEFGQDPKQQAEIVIIYPIETPKTFEEYVLESAATDLIRRALWRQIRTERNITYHAWAEIDGISNTAHGAKENYNSLIIYSAIQSGNTHLVMEGVDRLADSLPKLRILGGSVLREYAYWLEGKSLYTVSELAQDLINSEQIGYQKRYDPEEEIKIVRSLTARKVQERAQAMLQGDRVVHIAASGKSRELITTAASVKRGLRRK